MKFLITLLLIYVCSFNVMSQTSSLDCSLLQKSLETDIFDKQFFIRKSQKDDIIIIDTLAFFNSCQFDTIYGKKIKIIHNIPASKEENQILIYNIEQEKRKYIFYFLHRRSNANVILELTPKRRRLKIKVRGYGAF